MDLLRWKRALPLILLAGALTFAAACGDDDDDNGGDDATPNTTATTPAQTPTTDAGGDEPSQTPSGGETTTPEPTPGEVVDDLITVTDIGAGFGPVLTTKDGFVLYIFTNDEEGVSNCNGNCAATWPPLTFTGPNPPVVEGASGEFTLITRDDGSMQVAYEGQPLYTYAADITPGTANGDGVGNVWFVAKAEPE